MEEQLKLHLQEKGITVHRNMMGPVDIIDGVTVTAAVKHCLHPSDVDVVFETYKFTNFALYKIEDNKVRFAGW